MTARTTTAPANTDDLRGRMAAGGKVSASEWAAAETAERFALARQDAEERGERERREADRLARIAALTEAIPRELDPAPIERAGAELAAALDRFVGVCRDHDRRFGEALDALADGTLAPLPPGLGAEGTNVRSVTAGGQTFRRAPTQRTINETATAAIARHYPRQTIDLGRPSD